MNLQDALNLAENLLSSTEYTMFKNYIENNEYMRARTMLIKYEGSYLHSFAASRLEDFVINLIMIDDDDERYRFITSR